MLVQQRGTAYSVHAPAKLNLFFEVRQRRRDGFHEIETLMIPVSLYDTLYFRSAPRALSFDESTTFGESHSAIRFSCRDLTDGFAAADPHREIPTDASNLVVRAIELLRERSGVETSAEVELVKRIPAAAGLGGGSSDAAAALLAANAAWSLGWSRSRLGQLAAELGSDVPFFLGRGAAVCRGRGEIVEPVAGLGDWHAVVVTPPVGLSTPEVYAQVEIPSQPRSVDTYIEKLRGAASRVAPQPYNTLESAALKLTPWIDRLRSEVQRTGCRSQAMSGSGSSYFGIYPHARAARRAARQLQGRGLGGVFVVRSAA